MQKRKKKIFDGTDRDILRVLYEKRPLVSREIARKVGLSAAAIAPRLSNLQEKGIIKKVKVSGIRKFERNFKNKKIKVSAPRSIFWSLDLVRR